MNKLVKNFIKRAFIHERARRGQWVHTMRKCHGVAKPLWLGLQPPYARSLWQHMNVCNSIEGVEGPLADPSTYAVWKVIY